MRDGCPNCGASGVKDDCRQCGWTAGGKKGAGNDPNRFRCEWAADGERCRYPGTSSHSTTGGGPWYCSGHFRAAGNGDGRLGARIVEESKSIAFPDYSGKSMREASLRAFLAKAQHRQPGEEG